MKQQISNPNDLNIPNGCFFGLSSTVEESPLVFLSVPWDVTTSYHEGTANGPQAIIDASYQIDLYDFDLPKVWQIGYGTLPIDTEIKKQNTIIRAIAKRIIKHLEDGNSIGDKAISQQLRQVNEACANLNNWVYNQCKTFLNQGKLIGLVGGDHSVPLGYLKALSEMYKDYSILQIDAHADLRDTYQGFIYSHASIMNNVLKIPNINRLVQVGIRDLSEQEMQTIKEDSRIILFNNWQIKNNSFEGITWKQQCETIIDNLSDKVYISFDIDGLNPAFCPNTGTPVPGGLDFNEAIYLIQLLVKSGKKMIGFDLCEVAPSYSDQWDGNVGARLLYKLANLTYKSCKNGYY